MSVTLLVSSLNKNPDEFIRDNHISGNAVIVNQCDRENQREILSDSSRIVIIETNSRGVGVNRNLCIDNSFGDIVLFGDDDIVYDEDYAEKVEN